MTGSLAIICANSAHNARQTRSLRRIEPVSSANEGGERRRPQTPHTNDTAPRQNAIPLSSVVAHILGGREYGASPAGYEAYTKAARLLELQSHRVDVTGI
jgi:hypothetical protein